MLKKLKTILQNNLDWLQFKLDTTRRIFQKSTFDYQPIPWIGINEAPIRGQATIERLDAITPFLKDSASLKDIGCCVGFFCFSASSLYEIDSIGIDMNEKFLRIANYTKKFFRDPEKVTFLNLSITPKRATLIPRTDATICFSIWHHWVFHYGLDGATSILKTIWEGTNKVLFFESGEEETMEEFELPFDKEAKLWLQEYLVNVLPSSSVEPIGTFSAGQYAHYPIHGFKRTVFKITKI